MFSKIKKFFGVLAMPALLLVGSLAIAGQGQVVDGNAQTNGTTATFNKPTSAVGTKNMNADDVRKTITNIANILAFIVIALSVIFIIVGAFQWMSGNEKDGKEKVKNAVIGLIITIVAYAIVQIVAGAVVGIVTKGQTGATGQIGETNDFISP